jgi:hypothetical protein
MSDCAGLLSAVLLGSLAACSDVRQTAEIVVLTAIIRPLAFTLVMLNAQPTRTTPTNLLLTDSQGTDVVVMGVSIDYGWTPVR